jgi:hypothetical protein
MRVIMLMVLKIIIAPVLADHMLPHFIAASASSAVSWTS